MLQLKPEKNERRTSRLKNDADVDVDVDKDVGIDLENHAMTEKDERMKIYLERERGRNCVRERGREEDACVLVC